MSTLLGTNFISGVVIDADTRQPVAGASVVITKAGQSTLNGIGADGNGAFALFVPDASSGLRITAVGYAPYDIASIGLSSYYQVPLKKSIVTLPGVTVTAPAAGDKTNMWLWVGAAAAAWFLFFNKKKRR